MPGLRYWDGTAWQPIAPSPSAAVLDPWHLVGTAGEPAFGAGWQNYAGENPVGFRKDPGGRVLIKGLAQILSGAGTTVFTLPVGYRPLKTTREIVASLKGPLFVQVLSTGEVSYANLTGYASLAANDWIDWSLVEFDTESVTSYPIGPTGPPGSQPAAVALDVWHTVGAAGEPAYGAGVTAHAEGGIQFRKAPDGKVLLRGVVNCPATGNTVLFTLPVGYRPARSPYVRFTMADASTGGAGYLYVDGNGVVTKGGSNTTADVACVEFDTDTVSSIPQGPAGPMGPAGPAGAAPVASLDTWHTVGAAGEPAFNAPWANATGFFTQFRKDPTGRVAIRGVPQNTGGVFSYGTGTGRVFTLPTGYRPPQAFNRPVICWDADGSVDLVRVIVGTAGEVYISGPVTTGSAVSGAVNSQLNLDGIEFDTDTVTQVTAVAANVQMDTWHTVGATGEPAFTNSWVNYDATAITFPVAAFRKDPLGRVQLRGLVKSGTVPATVFTLPVGYRPLKTQIFGASANSAFGEIRVDLSGAVSVNLGSNVFVDLSLVAFDTDSVTQVAAGVGVQPIEPVHIVGNPGEPAFQNAWVNYDPVGVGARPARFRRFPDGRVRLYGVIKTGASGTTVFTLPVGYRPPVGEAFSVIAGGNALAEVTVDTAGAVIAYNWSTGANVAVFCYLDGIEFDTETVGNYTAGSINGTGLWLPQDEGVDLAARAKVNFQGSGIRVADDAPNNRANVIVPGGAGLETVSLGPITGSGGVLSATSANCNLPGMVLNVAPTVPVHVMVFYELRFENSAATWLWTFSMVRCATAQFQLKSGNANSSDLRTYYASVNWNNNQGWDYFRLPAGAAQFVAGAWQSGATVYWLATAENYMTALMWPQ